MEYEDYNPGDMINPDTGLTLSDDMELWGQAGQGLDPNGNGVGDAGFDWNSEIGQQILNDVQGGDSGGGKGFDLSKILSFLGMGGGGGGLSALMPLIAAGLSAAGGIYGVNQSKKATEAALGRIDDTEHKVNDVFGGMNGNLNPYTSVGAQGAQMLGALPQSALAGQFGGLAQNFQPLGTGRGIVGGPGRAPINNAGPARLTLGTLLGR